MSDIRLGIDLGTTFSAVAYVDDEGNAQVVENADGKRMTPSVVLVENGAFVVGEAAQNQWITNPSNVVRWIKRAIGDADYTFQGYTPVQISAEILKVLKADAELKLGDLLAEAVITCPAYFAAVEIENTKRAGELAGFHVREIVKEPTAAAVYYGVEHMQDGERVLVCDLGGGTYDATILAFNDGVFTPLATCGDRELGGHDWTMDLMESAAARFQEKLGDDLLNDSVAAQTLYENCEQAKRDYSKSSTAVIACGYRGKLEQVEITRDEFEQKTEWRIQNVVMRTRQALEKADPPLVWKDIHHVLLVGGSSRLRRLGLALQEVSGATPTLVQSPDLAVALGAAILAKGQVRPRKPKRGLAARATGGLVEVRYKRIIARSLGTRVVDDKTHPPVIKNSLIIRHSTESPVACSRAYEVTVDGQEYFDVPVVEFEDESDYDVIRSYRCWLRPKARRGDPIELTFTYDESGIVTAAAADVQTRESLSLEPRPYEEPNPEAIALIAPPRWVVFAVDVSGSMSSHGKLASAKDAVVKAARDLLAGGNGRRVGVVSFGSIAEVVHRPTADLHALEQAVEAMQCTGMTAMDAGIALAAEMLREAPPDAARDVVMVTDGMPNDRARTLEVARAVCEHGVTLSNLGIGENDVDLNFLKDLTPNAVVIGSASEMSHALAGLLREAESSRQAGLTEA